VSLPTDDLPSHALCSKLGEAAGRLFAVTAFVVARGDDAGVDRINAALLGAANEHLRSVIGNRPWTHRSTYRDLQLILAGRLRLCLAELEREETP
jgi:hypothetical protein